MLKWVRVAPTASTHQPKKQRGHKCPNPDCGKIFETKGKLKKHMVVHGERSFACMHEGCTKSFPDKSKLKRHQLVHTKEKHYQCEICLKRFSLDFNLRTHIRTHTGLKPYACEYPGCNKRFT